MIGDSREVRRVNPNNLRDVFNYKKSLKLYNESKKQFKNARIWLVAIDNEHNMKNLFYTDNRVPRELK